LNSPYITDRPLVDGDLFFGRTPSLDLLSDQLRRGERVLLLYGKRHIGKTSLLNQLSTFLGERFAVRRIEWSALDNGVEPLGRILIGISRVLGHREPIDQAALQGDRQAVARHVRTLFSATGARTELVCIDGVPMEELTPQGGWQEALAILHDALEQSTGLTLLFAIEGLRDSAQTWLDRYPEIVLRAFDEMSAEDLLITPVRGRLAFDYDSIRRVFRLSGGEPLLLQRFGAALFAERASAGWAGLPEVEQVVPVVLEQSSAEFAAQWQRLPPAAQIALSAFAEMPGSHGVGSAGDVSMYLSRLHIDAPMADIEAALETLAYSHILERLGGGTYRFQVELFRLWLRHAEDTVALVRATRRYRRGAPRRHRPMRPRRIDWASLLLWLLAGALAVLVIMVWRDRDTQIFWTAAPPETSSAVDAGQSNAPLSALPTPETGISPGHIVYMAKAHPDDPWDIHIMRSDGSDPVRLTQSGFDDTFPSLSPDGRQIAFVSNRDGNREVYVMQRDGSNPQNLTRNAAEDWTPTWSPDGRHIAFASFRDDNWEIYVMEADGNNQTRLTHHTAADYAPSWSPDGKHIAFVSNRDGNINVYVMDADGSQVRRFSDSPATDQSPSWSPDGQEIVWESYRHGYMDVYAAKLDGSDLRSISRDVYANDHGPTWSPWGTHIAFYSNRDGGWNIYTINLETGQRTNITMSDLWEQAPMWGR
jgi:hypothetical protein